MNSSCERVDVAIFGNIPRFSGSSGSGESGRQEIGSRMVVGADVK